MDLNRYRAIFLDGFGTLIDPADAPRRAAEAVARAVGWPDAAQLGRIWMAHSAAQDWTAGPFRTLRQHFASSLAVTFAELGIASATNGDRSSPGNPASPRHATIDALVQRDVAWIQRARPYRGAEALVGHLGRLLPVVLVTNADEDFIAPVLAASRFSFHHVLTSEAARVYKPEPEIFHAAARKVPCRPSEVLMIGDSWREDILGALAVGAEAIWLDRRRRDTPSSGSEFRVSGFGLEKDESGQERVAVPSGLVATVNSLSELTARLGLSGGDGSA